MDFFEEMKDVGIWAAGLGLLAIAGVAIYVLFYAEGLPSWIS